MRAVQDNSALMQHISLASRDQSAAIGDVTIAVRQMDEMTQHNAALVEQTESQASELDRLVDHFHLAEAGTAEPARRAVVPAPFHRAQGDRIATRQIPGERLAG